MSSQIRQNVTPEQKQTVIDVPSFIEKTREPLDEIARMERAMLNNVPGNVANEEENHLNGMGEFGKNLSDEEWGRLLPNAPSEMLISEIRERLMKHEAYREVMKKADEKMRLSNL